MFRRFPTNCKDRLPEVLASVRKYICSSDTVVSCSMSAHIGAHHLQFRFSAANVAFIVFRISTEHSPKLQIRSHSYLRAVSEVSINRSLDSLDPAGLLASPKFRSRNESYMRAMSTISQVSRGSNLSLGLSCSFNGDKVLQRSPPAIKFEVTIRSPSDTPLHAVFWSSDDPFIDSSFTFISLIFTSVSA